jgi:hypothetical protein
MDIILGPLINLASNGGQTVTAHSSGPGAAAVWLKVNYVTSGGLNRFPVGSDESNLFLYLLSRSTSRSSWIETAVATPYQPSSVKKLSVFLPSSRMKVRFPTESSIDDRPAILEEKKRIGDSEVDLMMGCKSGGGLLTLMDRNTR